MKAKRFDITFSTDTKEETSGYVCSDNVEVFSFILGKNCYTFTNTSINLGSYKLTKEEFDTLRDNLLSYHKLKTGNNYIWICSDE